MFQFGGEMQRDAIFATSKLCCDVKTLLLSSGVTDGMA